MLIYNKVLTSICLLLQLLTHIKAQGPPIFATQSSAGNAVKMNTNRLGLQDSVQISQGAEKFSLEFLKQISDAHISVPNRSYMVSPFAVWSLLLLLTEGAGGNTLTELRNTLHTGNDQNAVRAAYHIISRYLTVNTTTIEVASFNALFTNINKPVSRDYEDIIERDYASALIPVNFDDVNNTFTKINRDIREATRGLIPYTVTPQDFQDANILMVSSLYFKGKWKYPFEAKNTRPLPFYDEDGKLLGDVQMMTQMGLFTYVNVKELDAHVLELPYGKENRLSMLIILPKRGVKLNKIVNNLANVGVKEIHRQLNVAAQYYDNDDDKPEVEVFIPKFTTESHFTLSPILRNMGIQDLFDSSRANLDKIARDNYVSSIFHATRIIVNEEGTEAGAVTTAVLVNKASPTRFYVDRPFAYLIVEKTANVLLFAGEVKSNV
ncbi:serine protease inhibitor 77Ba-like [Lucilia sericata]|uniref:serine protease inhibitor 77Ba-like n=1 Tax=Lucilia sericata TaxID=13632 RepID=UPI0018A7F21F|nr:serine protease inhibitor 77Ba-like [Lucilia sericata]XP_037823487.1 serine protease inhibitor 77Ba-like [Lucilia sericata]XP_037823488.1 serine protease inhibitor 77Ba-like [Lucilia sericata]XP_037823489.1 serine protease inhibitor 77Ba-like [Lucilia sericata]XP_037823490.1 serine protease inhibitor 77Ba-like [Lucilia sericata]XP_037823491.1 serine protease inhibitor 77Ba-like [Lucilia sericata]